MKVIAKAMVIFFFAILLIPGHQDWAATTKPAPTMYSTVLQAVRKMDTKIDLSSFYKKKQRFSVALIEQIENDDPSLFYLSNVKMTLWSNGVLQLGYKYPKATIVKMQKQINDNADSILRKVITKGMTDEQKVMAIHDYLADWIQYDRKNFEANTIPDLSHTAYGSLVNHVAVCDGYSYGINLLLNKAGIESRVISGNGIDSDGNSVAHAWNLVKVGGAYYYLDLTWDDNDQKGKYPNAIYNYYLVSEQELSKDHTWIKTGLPKATSTKYKELHTLGYDFSKTKDGYYFSNEQDNNKLYYMKRDGSGKKALTTVRALDPVPGNDCIYFSNYDNGGYLYKVNKNGGEPMQLNEAFTIPLKFENGILIAKDGDTNTIFQLALASL